MVAVTSLYSNAAGCNEESRGESPAIPRPSGLTAGICRSAPFRTGHERSVFGAGQSLLEDCQNAGQIALQHGDGMWTTPSISSALFTPAIAS
jgi:hypothetical protein